MTKHRVWILLIHVLGMALASDLACDTASNCTALAERLQVTGTQESFTESTVVLYNALEQWSDDYDLWSSYGKLNLFYTLNWQIAKDAIDASLQLDESAENLNTFLFSGWLHSTAQYRDISTASGQFQRAIDLIPSSNNPSNFWPHFEYAVFLSHIAEDYEESQRLFEVAVNASSLENPFIAFFYGLLLEYHLCENDLDGEQLIESAMQVAEAGYLPGQAGWNMAFQGLLLDSMGRKEEAQQCCEFSAAIMNKSESNWHLFCPNILNNNNNEGIENEEDNDDVDGSQDKGSSGACGFLRVTTVGMITLVAGICVIWQRMF